MDERKFFFTDYHTVGRSYGISVVYTVHINISGRVWEDRNILVPVKQWKDGVREFGFVSAFGVTYPQYKVTRKVEKALDALVPICEEWGRRTAHIEELKRMIATEEAALDALYSRL